MPGTAAFPVQPPLVLGEIDEEEVGVIDGQCRTLGAQRHEPRDILENAPLHRLTGALCVTVAALHVLGYGGLAWLVLDLDKQVQKNDLKTGPSIGSPRQTQPWPAVSPVGLSVLALSRLDRDPDRGISLDHAA